MGARHFGARIARLEDPALLTGRGRFVDDIRLAGALHACFVRSPYAHAKIRSLDAFAARAMPGVHAVLTADDLPARMARSQIPMLVPNPSITAPRTQLALARREVCYVGQTIAVAIADNRYLAEDAAAAVNVDFETLPAVSDCREAARPDAPPAHSDLASNVAAVVAMSYGDVEAAFARAAHVFEDELFLHRGGAMTLEGRAVLASYDAGADMLTVWSATQTPHLCRATLADLFERDLEAIRVIAPHVGGGFGTKAPFYAEEAVIPAAAMKLGARSPGKRTGASIFSRPRRNATSIGKSPLPSTTKEKSSGSPAPCCTIPEHSCRGASSCPTSPQRHFLDPTWCRLIASKQRSCSPTACRPRSCAAPAVRRRFSPWSGSWIESRGSSTSTAPNCVDAT